MKPFILLLIFIFFTFNSFSQNTFPSSGNVGLGTLTPGFPLTVYTSYSSWQSRFQNGGSNVYLAHGGGYGIHINTGGTNDPNKYALEVRNDIHTHLFVRSDGFTGIGTLTPGYPLHLITGNSGWQSRFQNGNSNVYFAHGDGYGVHINTGGANDPNKYALQVRNDTQTHLYVQSDGKVGIGTTTPDEILTVKGTIHTEEVKIDLTGALVPDFVFEEAYDLRTLKETKAFIKENKHLPGVPSAAMMKENGIDVKSMNLKLLQKIEELTLYIIDQNERIEKLEAGAAGSGK